jgi:hypothetical protein
MPELPAPLEPHERTVGQLVGESIRVYGAHFWRALPLGLPLLLIDQAAASHGATAGVQLAIFYAATPLMVAAYLWACRIVCEVRPSRQAALVALLVYLPFPLLRALYTLPGLAWFALIGLAVPAALVERGGVRDALARGLELGRADYVHALGGLAALVIVVGVGDTTLSTLLRSQGEASARVALGLSDLVLSPLLYLGAAMLYFDQAARVGLQRTARGRSAPARLDAEPPAPTEPSLER